MKILEKKNFGAVIVFRLVHFQLLMFNFILSLMFYIIGLGNPGKEYNQTRHNVGRDLVVGYREAHGLGDWSPSTPAQADITSGQIQGKSVELVLPNTFMNRSGETARFLIEKQGAQPEDLVVVYDDIDLPLGQFKISKDRGHGGHNGVKSIETSIKSQAFTRVRVGIAETSFWTGRVRRPSGGDQISKYVLKPFSKKELNTLEGIQRDVFDAIDLIVNDGVAVAMNQYN